MMLKTSQRTHVHFLRGSNGRYLQLPRDSLTSSWRKWDGWSGPSPALLTLPAQPDPPQTGRQIWSHFEKIPTTNFPYWLVVVLSRFDFTGNPCWSLLSVTFTSGLIFGSSFNPKQNYHHEKLSSWKMILMVHSYLAVDNHHPNHIWVGLRSDFVIGPFSSS